MPPKAKPAGDFNASAHFLHLCMQKSDLSVVSHPSLPSPVTIVYDYLCQINFYDVANELGINVNAARMRYYRLKKSLENSTENSDVKKDDGIAPAANSEAPAKSTATKRAAPKAAAKTSKTAAAKASPAKRRKVKQESSDEEDIKIKQEESDEGESTYEETTQEETSQDAYEGDKDSAEE